MTQLDIKFPPPMTAAQVAAAIELARLVEANKQSFQLKDYVRRRDAALKHSRRVAA